MSCPQGAPVLSRLSIALLCPSTLWTPGQSAEHDTSTQRGHQPVGDLPSIPDTDQYPNTAADVTKRSGQGGRCGDREEGPHTGVSCLLPCQGAVPPLSALPLPATSTSSPTSTSCSHGPLLLEVSLMVTVRSSFPTWPNGPSRLSLRPCPPSPLLNYGPSSHPSPLAPTLCTPQLSRRPTVQQTPGETLIPPSPSASHWPWNPARYASKTSPHFTSKPLHCSTPSHHLSHENFGLLSVSLPPVFPMKDPLECHPTVPPTQLLTTSQASRGHLHSVQFPTHSVPPQAAQ